MFGRKAKKAVVDEARINAILSRGVVEAIDATHLKKRLLSSDVLRVKLGIDPTGADIHIGHAINLLKLRDFQELGHQVVLIIGDATGVVGDTSDKDSERPMLSREEITKNKKTYLEQAGKLLNMKRTEVRHNAEWLDQLTFDEIGEQANEFSVAEFIARDNIRRRMDSGKRVSLREMLYPLMQGYDSVAVRADVELGGTDQRFNLLAGRTLQKHYGQNEQDILMSELLEGTDGNKMSKSAGNTINLLDTPEDMYGKTMRVHDGLLERYFMLTTRIPQKDVEQILKQHPKDAKMRLARELVTMYHGKRAAEQAEEHFVTLFSKGEVAGDIEEVVLLPGTALLDALLQAHMVASKSEWRRLVEQGAVSNMETKEKITNTDHTPQNGDVLRIGKKRFVRITLQ